MHSELYLNNKKAFYEDFDRLVRGMDETIERSKER